MPSSQIGALRVTLGLDSANFETGTKRARAEATKTASSIKSSFGGISSVLTGFVAGIGVSGVLAAAKAGLEYASSLGEVAQQLGVTSNDLQIYRAVGKEVGITQEEMDVGLRKLTLSIGQAAAGSKKQAETFRELGIAVVDINGRVRTAGEVIPRLADALAKIKDPATRARIEVDLFGKTGQKLDTLLAGGSKAVNNLADAYRKFGAILTPQQIKQADEAADTLQRIKTILSAKIAGWVSDAVPQILGLVHALERLGDLPSKYPQLFRIIGLLNSGASALNPLAFGAKATGLFNSQSAPSASEVLAARNRALDAQKRLSVLASKGASNAALDDQRIRVVRLAQAASALGKAYNAAQAALGPATGATQDGPMPDAPDAKLPRTGRAAKAAKEEVDGLAKAMQDFNENLASLTSSNAGVFEDLAKGITPQPDDVLSRAMDLIDQKKSAELDAADEVARHKKEIEQNNLQELAGLYEALFTQGTKGFLQVLEQQLTRIISQLLAQLTSQLLGLGGSGGGGGLLGSLFGGGGGGGLLGSLFGGGGGFTTPAADFSGIPGIGFASGGSFRVGGTGAIDSKLIQFRATPGEMVDVRKPGNDNSRGGGTIVVQVDKSELFDVHVSSIATPIAVRHASGALSRAPGATVDFINRNHGRVLPHNRPR